MHAKGVVIVGALLACAGWGDAADVILNEYNAVGANEFLEEGAVDPYWGPVPGNGGDWFELVVITDHLDMREWQFVIHDDSVDPDQTLVLTTNGVWDDLRAGTIVTVSEELGNNADEYSPADGQWWLNVKAANGTNGTYITAANFRVNNDGWQLTIKDDAGAVIFGPAGEGIQPPAGVNSQEVCKLEEGPSASIIPLSNYQDGQSSTFGSANLWGGGAYSQDLCDLRSGVTTCAAAADCDDGSFCNGAEWCDTNGVCQCGTDPCPGRMCDEARGVCADCLSNADCDDGNPCTVDTCDLGTCVFSAIPGCGDGGTPPPDADHDGVIDMLDECPDTPEGKFADERGCACSQLDDDGDGVDDCVDECPGTPGDKTADERGCACSQLDDDEDGVDDCDDRCPDTPSGETVDADGCSPLHLDHEEDDDGDGVPNHLDGCEGTPPGEATDTNGCSCLQLDPDRDDDGDGVLNCLDRCADTPAGEVVDDAGCTVTPPVEDPPAESPTDTAGDTTVAPSDDGKPDTARSPSARGSCGFIGPVSSAFMFAGMAALRFAHRRRPRPPAPSRRRGSAAYRSPPVCSTLRYRE